MTVDTSIGLDDPRSPTQSGIDDETRARKARQEGDAVERESKDDESKGDLTREDIERGNDRNTTADQGNRSGTTNRLQDDGIDLGR